MTGQDRRIWGYLVIWEFLVRPGTEGRFQQLYEAGGEWSRLFQRADAYLGTDLIQDTRVPQRYLTLDFWASQAAYDRFRQDHVTQYKAIDEKGAALTESEREVGRFCRIP